MVKGIIEAHKGKIQVQSELHKGTVFTFELPVVFSGGNGGSMYNEK